MTFKKGLYFEINVLIKSLSYDNFVCHKAKAERADINFVFEIFITYCKVIIVSNINWNFFIARKSRIFQLAYACVIFVYRIDANRPSSYYS